MDHKELLFICLKDKAKFALFFQNYRTFTPSPRARQRSENPTPGGTRMCESPGVARGGGGCGEGWSGLELTDTLHIRELLFGEIRESSLDDFRESL